MDASQLSISQLQQVRSQMVEDADALAQSLAQLRQIESKYRSCGAILDQLVAADANNTQLVPLTTALYVPGSAATDRSVLVDVGTGYFIERNPTDAMQYYRRKTTFVADNAAKLQTTVAERRKQVGNVTELLAAKIDAARAQQAQMHQQQQQQEQEPSQSTT